MENQIIIAGYFNELSKQWCVYELRDARTAEVKYVGCCKFFDVLRMPDARNNILYDKIFTSDTPHIISVRSYHDQKVYAMSAQSKLINYNNVPDMNRVSALKRHAQVKCIETGEVFRNVQECVDAHDLSQSALSNHLNNRPGYNTVKGRRYIRVLPEHMNTGVDMSQYERQPQVPSAPVAPTPHGIIIHPNNLTTPQPVTYPGMSVDDSA